MTRINIVRMLNCGRSNMSLPFLYRRRTAAPIPDRLPPRRSTWRAIIPTITRARKLAQRSGARLKVSCGARSDASLRWRRFYTCSPKYVPDLTTPEFLSDRLATRQPPITAHGISVGEALCRHRQTELPAYATPRLETR